MEDGEVSYETLQDLLRSERRSNKLTPVRDAFWNELQAFLRAAEAEFRAEQARDPWARRAMMLSDRVKNARHAAESVWALRERKLAMLALAHVREGGHPEGLTKHETALYGRVLATLRDGREEVFAGTSAAPSAAPRPAPTTPAAATKSKGPAAPPASDLAPPADQERPVAPTAPPRATAPSAPQAPPRTPHAVPADTPEPGIVTIRALGDIPPFVGPDMDTYRLKDGDLASVPKNIADLLVRRGKAAVVEAV